MAGDNLLNNSKGTQIQDYADDIAMLVVRQFTDIVLEIMNQRLQVVNPS